MMRYLPYLTLVLAACTRSNDARPTTDGEVDSAPKDASARADGGADAGIADAAPDANECSEGVAQERPCPAGPAARRTCLDGRFGEWTACAELDCEPGESARGACGRNGRGELERACIDGLWVDGECVDPDVCFEGTQQIGRCGPNQRGRRERECADGQWSAWSACGDADSCEDGAMQEQACGLNGNGVRARRCVNGQWNDGACDDVDECLNGSAQERACDGAGVDERGCVAGRWGPWSGCAENGECVEATVQAGACGLNGNGTRERLCIAATWGEWGGCADPDECENGAGGEQACGVNGARRGVADVCSRRVVRMGRLRGRRRLCRRRRSHRCLRAQRPGPPNSALCSGSLGRVWWVRRSRCLQRWLESGAGVPWRWSARAFVRAGRVG